MCGIVGVAERSLSRRYAPADVCRMAAAIAHRGPDDVGIHDGGEAILGMSRLSIIDLEGGRQPLASEDGAVRVVCNGEIYNFRTLRRALEGKGHRFATGSDAEVLVHLYEDRGAAFLDELQGMFGLALWDARRRTLLMARDRLGIKPLYYWPYPGGIAFASEIKAFLTLPGFRAEIDTAALSDYMSIGYAVAPRTIFRGVYKLPPATLLSWRGGLHTVTRYWTPPHEVEQRIDRGEWVERVREALERAVADHMISDVPLGAFLSGGIDSSAVAVMMARHGAQPLNAYSIGYRGRGASAYYNELPYARIVAAEVGAAHREIEVAPDVTRLWPKLIWHLEEPISDSAITTTYLVSQLAAKSVKVILSGVGGDELFAGYNRYLGGVYGRRYNRLPAWARRGVMPWLAQLLPSGRQNRWMDMARYAKRFVQANALDWREQYKLYVALADRNLLADLPIRGAARHDDGLDEVLSGEHAGDELLRLLRVDWQSQLSEALLLLTDKMSMACSIECRVPFLDHRLVELAARIPAAHKLAGGRPKGLLKSALEDALPSAVIARPKRGFGAPVGAWFKRELAPLRGALLNREAVAARGLLDPAVVQSLCADHDASREDYTDLILVLLNLEIWCRLFLDGAAHQDVAGELAERSMVA